MIYALRDIKFEKEYTSRLIQKGLVSHKDISGEKSYILLNNIPFAFANRLLSYTDLCVLYKDKEFFVKCGDKVALEKAYTDDTICDGTATNSSIVVSAEPIAIDNQMSFEEPIIEETSSNTEVISNTDIIEEMQSNEILNNTNTTEEIHEEFLTDDEPELPAEEIVEESIEEINTIENDESTIEEQQVELEPSSSMEDNIIPDTSVEEVKENELTDDEPELPSDESIEKNPVVEEVKLHENIEDNVSMASDHPSSNPMYTNDQQNVKDFLANAKPNINKKKKN